jgi:hypothetical protein
MQKKYINIHQENKKINARIFWDFIMNFESNRGYDKHADGVYSAKLQRNNRKRRIYGPGAGMVRWVWVKTRFGSCSAKGVLLAFLFIS